jgi:MOSC domain-containing protein YiiM
MQNLKDLMNHFPKPGRLELIMLRISYRGEINLVSETEALEGIGLKGDHRDSKKANDKAKRQLTLIQAEHLPMVASSLGLTNLDPTLTRRNLLVSGINLLALKDIRFKIGDVVLEGTGPCHPCSRMEENLGLGGYNAMRGHGGITARVIKGGVIKVGSQVLALPEAKAQELET